MQVLRFLPVLGAVVAAFVLRWPAHEVLYGEAGMVEVKGQTETSGPLDTEAYTRETVYFRSSDESCEGWLYLPKRPRQEEPAASGSDAATPPAHRCIIMGHGLGAQKDMGLHPMAEHFASAGFAVLAFDYRSFGGSSGTPRHYISPTRHVEDWEAALSEMRGAGFEGKVRCERVALWGTSFAGGHVLMVAAKHPDAVSAVVSQAPHLSGREAAKASLQKRGVLGALRILLAGLHDKVRGTLGLDPAYIRLVGLPGELAFMQLEPEELEAYYAKHPKTRLGGWRPYVLARLSLELSRYSPIHELHRVKAPVMFVSAANDSLCPPELVRQAAWQLSSGSTNMTQAAGSDAGHANISSAGGRGRPPVKLLEYPCTHFEIYLGAVQEDARHQMTAWMLEHTGGAM